VRWRDDVAVVMALAVSCASCGAGWHRPAQLEPGSLSPRQQVQVWSGGSARRWHAVRVGPDSLSGIAFAQPTTCDSCRVALPRAAVDSMRLGDPVAGFWKTVGLVLGAFTLALIYTCRGGCGGYD
jgi:hypothetical protein